MMMLTETSINPRFGIELTILHFNPNISDKDLLDLREDIFLKAFNSTTHVGGGTMYVRDYYLYSRKKMA